MPPRRRRGSASSRPPAWAAWGVTPTEVRAAWEAWEAWEAWGHGGNGNPYGGMGGGGVGGGSGSAGRKSYGSGDAFDVDADVKDVRVDSAGWAKLSDVCR